MSSEVMLSLDDVWKGVVMGIARAMMARHELRTWTTAIVSVAICFIMGCQATPESLSDQGNDAVSSGQSENDLYLTLVDEASVDLAGEVTILSRQAQVGQPLTWEMTIEGLDSAAENSLLLRWDFGDGGSADGATVVHEFARSGVHVVAVEAFDESGTRVFRHLGAVEIPDVVHQENVTETEVDEDAEVVNGDGAVIIASAGLDQDVDAGEQVLLNGSQTTVDRYRPAVYSWVQTRGPAVALQGANTLTASFEASQMSSYPTELEFRLTVEQGPQLSSDAVVVRVWQSSTSDYLPLSNVNTNASLPRGVVPAFPGAEGLGAMAQGGRGGQVVYVTSTADYDWDEEPIPGTFRWAVEQVSGPRNVLFAVGGNIELTRSVEIDGEDQGWITIAGQTAPGDGIQLTRFGIKIRDGAHDVVIRYLRIRPGFTNWDEWGKDAVTIVSDASRTVSNVILDHCSLEWAIDENANVWGNVRRVTFQWCIFGEGSVFGHVDGAHSCGLLAGGEYSGNYTDYLTVHHNLFVNNKTRNPRLSGLGDLTHVINNVICNIQSCEIQIARQYPDRPSPRVNIIANVIDRSAVWGGSLDYRQINVYGAQGGSNDIVPVDDGSIYVEGNIALPGYKMDPDEDDWKLVRDMQGNLANQELSLLKRRQEPWPDESTVPVSVNSALDVKEIVVANAGATFPRRDIVDARIIQEAEDGTGTPGFGTEDDYQDWPMLASGQSMQDSDSDGMPDGWEADRNLDPTDPSDGALDRNSDGYTNLEEYLHWLVK